MKKISQILSAVVFTGGLFMVAPASAEVVDTTSAKVSYSASTCEVIDQVELPDGRTAVIIACVGNGDGTI
ncbi:hypothetical protein [Erythrobacter sp. MTPC3]|uniref:hypothetical protein n=1 Tax=Erythrobacter sp. MTPC3 TaxID=3056564 RepID=UPI0036F28DC0